MDGFLRLQEAFYPVCFENVLFQISQLQLWLTENFIGSEMRYNLFAREGYTICVENDTI